MSGPPSPLPPGVDPMAQKTALLEVVKAIKDHVKAHGKGSVPGGLQAWGSDAGDDSDGRSH